MKILLINANPVVSRLFTLCTRAEDIVLDEVKRMGKSKETDYDILFVDDASYDKDVEALLEKRSMKKKVLISYVENDVKGFDETIKKPFLPSQITKVIDSIDMSDSIEENKQEDEEAFNIIADTGTEVLDGNEIEKIKALLDMDNEDTALNVDQTISEDEYEARKVKIIKEQLIADGLEIIEEDAIVEALSTSVLDTLDVSSPLTKKTKKSQFTLEELTRVEKAFTVAMSKLKAKKIKKLLKGKEIEIKIKLEDDQ